MLLQMFFYILMLAGIAALAIDVGYTRLTQALMQNAVDSAALAGLRQRDTATGPRGEANAMIDEAFTDPEGLRRMGAGPDINFDPTAEDFSANQLYHPETSGPWVPRAKPSQPEPLFTNAGNCANGDMVAGDYDPGAEHTEQNDYTRPDFTPPLDACGGSGTPAGPPTSFLVRLRRTDSPADRIEDVSSTGPTVPLMFGRATPIGSLRGDGIKVRATAIASARAYDPLHQENGANNVVQAGPPGGPPGFEREGITPFTLTRACWEILAPGTFTVSGNVVNGNGPGVCGTTSGRAILLKPIAIGTVPLLDDSGPIPTGDLFQRYLPIAESSSDLARVIGFGYVKIDLVPGSSPVQFTISPFLGHHLATGNASALLPASHGPLDETLLQANRTLFHSLVAPALAR